MRLGSIIITHPWVLYMLIPLTLLLLYKLRKKYVRDEDRLFTSVGRKRMMLIFRILFFA